MSIHTINTASALERYAGSLRSKVEESFKQISDIGLDVIANRCGYTEGGEITVSKQPIEGGYKISSSGRGVYMLEFGAGVTTDSGHPYASQAEYPISPGSYSQAHAQQFVQHGFWVWGGMVMDHVTPRRGMYHGATEMRKEAKNVFKKVFEQS